MSGGAVNTVAGKQCAFSEGLGDGGPALQVCLKNPSHFTMNDTGEWFITDSGNGNPILAKNAKVNPSGLIYVIDRSETIFMADSAGYIHKVFMFECFGMKGTKACSANGMCVRPINASVMSDGWDWIARSLIALVSHPTYLIESVQLCEAQQVSLQRWIPWAQMSQTSQLTTEPKCVDGLQPETTAKRKRHENPTKSLFIVN